MTDDDYTWLFNFAKEVKEHPDAYIACSDCDLFEKCQEENRDYCEKEEVKNGKA